MGKWLAKFSADIPDSRTDKADTVGEMGTMSGMSVPDMDVSVKITTPDSADERTPPLQAGWRIVYLNHQWKLAGGCDDPDHGTVQACHWVAGAWTVTLTDGQTMPLSKVRSVGAVDDKGKLYGAWTVREHGYDGEGPVDGRRASKTEDKQREGASE